jgi:hypothetical protein
LPPNSEQSANRRHSIILNEGVNPDAWGFLLKNVNRNQFTIEKLPETYAFAKESKNDENGQSRFQFFRDTDSSFGRWSESTEWQGWTLNSPRRKTSLEKKGDRYVETETYDEPMESYAQRQDKDIIVYIGDGCFARLLELDRNSETMYPTTIDSVRGPFDQSLWEVSYSKAVNEEQTVLVECVLDADQDWRVVKSTISGWLDDTVVTTETTYAKWFGQRIPHEFTRVRKKPDGSSSWRTSIRPLAPAVAEEIKADVLREIDRGPDPPTWRERLSHRVRGPAILKYGWPSFAAILLVGSRLRRTKPT